MVVLTPQELQVWLEWAGARLIAMPGPRVGPAGTKVIWPDYAQEKFEVLEFRGAISVHAAAPSSIEIPIVDEILALPNVCAWAKTRRVLHLRALVHPLNGRYLYNWTRIATRLESERRIVRQWHRKGLEEVVSKADKTKVCRIAAFLEAAERAYSASLVKEA